MPRRRKKRPRRRENPTDRKQARRREEPTENQAHPSWHLGDLDLEGPFGARSIEVSELLMIRKKLASFESMTWNEILVEAKKQHHAVAVADISSEAQRRLVEIALDDEDDLISLRLGGRKRLWGIRRLAVLSILWWDPAHRVFPSKERHT